MYAALDLMSRAFPADGAPGVNLSKFERVASVALGGGLALVGLRGGPLRLMLAGAAGATLVYRGITGRCHVYDALGINTADDLKAGVPAQQGVRVEVVTRIDRPAADVYKFWRRVENLPKFMRHLLSVRDLGDGQSYWTARAILGATVEWAARIINDQPNELIAWESLPGASVETAGSVHFEPIDEGRATEVRLLLKYNPPLGKAGVALATFLGQDAAQMIRADMQDFKRLLEERGSSIVSTPAAAGGLSHRS